jgi:hypothetical protein
VCPTGNIPRARKGVNLLVVGAEPSIGWFGANASGVRAGSWMRAPELFELTVRSGLKVLETMLEAERPPTPSPEQKLTAVIGSTRIAHRRSQIPLLSGPPSRPPDR